MKVILNYLPPGRIDQPSSSLSILQSFLTQNGIEVKTIYWNILMLPLTFYYENSHDVFRNVFPFLADLAEEYNDSTIRKKLVSYLQSQKPFFKTSDNFYSNSLDEIQRNARQLIRTELQKEGNEAVLYGISARFYQWIPGRMLAKAIKQLYPAAKIVVGGLSSHDAAIAMLKKNPDFDYAVWGEGEYPLLDLCNHLEHNSVSLENIPRLVYRDGEELIANKPMKSGYLDFTDYIFPDISDYFETLAANKISKESVQILIHSVCGCRWNKCSFCSYSTDKVFRERTAENIFQEIKTCSEKYGINNFYMADNEMVGKDIVRFERLLDLLIDFNQDASRDFRIYGEMIPSSGITPAIFGKMSKAGFKFLFIGYEAVTDSLLKKMRKENSFSENIYFVKQALKNNIKPQANIIQEIPNETDTDIVESTNNLHYLRFFFHLNGIEFKHDFITLNLYKGTEYFRKMPDEEKENYGIHAFSDFIPASFISKQERWDFFSYRRNFPLNSTLWYHFLSVERFYRKNKFTCKVVREEQGLVFKEYFNNELIKNLSLTHPLYFRILAETENSIMSIAGLQQKFKVDYPELTENKLKEFLNVLKSNHMIYCSDDYMSIISVICMDINELIILPIL